MTPLKSLAATAAVAVGLMAVIYPASAGGRHGHGHHHHGARFSFGFWGGPYWGPGYWGPGWGYWGPPAVVYAPAPEPRVWVESNPVPAPPPASSPDTSAPQWWYWCASSRGYYPYVSSCAEGWQRVAPQPQAPR
ncbi:MAG TPA: hypothetical protein VM937_10965 [Burkholderiaceae bacterium]|jgi:hypothetical protein|nr:hypothetical protein [Burkholderiaceae bacterium]